MSILKKEKKTKKEPPKIKDMELIKPNGCIISKSIYEKKANIKWLYRDDSVNETDSGWRIVSNTKDKDLIITDINTIEKLAPLFKKVKNYPIGTDLEFNHDDAGDYFIDRKTKTRLWL